MRYAVVLAVALMAAMLAVGRAGAAAAPKRPNIVYLLMDDLGWKDVGFHGSEIKTPNLDRLAASGARLEQFYVMPVCTPTRAAFLTGRFPMRYGLQTGVNRPWADWGLPLEERLLPQRLKEAGYVTAIVGKWHLGASARDYLPTKRGFDHQYGHYCGAIDYYTHDRDGGFDWHRDDRASRDEGYGTDLIGREAVRLIQAQPAGKPLFLYVPFSAPHAPLQAPQEHLDRYAHLPAMRRRKYAAMVSCVDDHVGRIVAALEQRGMTKDTLILFSSDNGGPEGFGAHNGELRAGKHTLYEGGVRVPAFAVWPDRIKAGTVVNEPLHVVDWFPTLLRLAGVPASKQSLPLDGKDIWRTLTAGRPSPHKELLLNTELNRGAVRVGKWKLVFKGRLPAAPDQVGELYDLSADPGEMTDLAAREPDTVKQLLARLNHYAAEAAPSKNDGGDTPPAGYKTPAVYGEP
ncbi:MAG: arylsulfatase B [Actinomycetota bacterium]